SSPPAARRELLHLQFEQAHRAHRSAARLAPRGRAVPDRAADRRARRGVGERAQDRARRHRRGADLKWNPLANAAIDATVNPDFSQVESDAAQIVANERFALFFPEKRPFFLEGVDLLSTPLQAVYTRTVTDPRAGLRATGKFGPTAYTALVTQDRGGGRVIL